MIGGQGFHVLDCAHNQPRHGGVVVIPARMVVLTDFLRQLRIRHGRPEELALENDQNGIAVTRDVLLCIRFVRHLYESIPEPMCL